MHAMSTSPLPPDLQVALENLFEFFSAYVVATNADERSKIQAQIVDLFSRLGVASESALVRRAAEIFDRIKKEPAPSRFGEATLANVARTFVASHLRAFERVPNHPSLSAGARQLLRTPVVEAVEFGMEFDREQVSNSLNILLSTVMEGPVTRTEGTAQIRTSISVIRALSKNFCRIPPFCSQAEEK
jgi:hypothetical protein